MEITTLLQGLFQGNSIVTEVHLIWTLKLVVKVTRFKERKRRAPFVAYTKTTMSDSGVMLHSSTCDGSIQRIAIN